MIAQRNDLIQLVEKNGWQVSRLTNSDFKNWSMETWLLESVWTPVGKTVYVFFPIDPLSDFQNPSAWSILVRENTQYQPNQKQFEVSLKQWKNEKIDFVKFLANLRNNSQNVEK
jgi:hypothetical protein